MHRSLVRLAPRRFGGSAFVQAFAQAAFRGNVGGKGGAGGGGSNASPGGSPRGRRGRGRFYLPLDGSPGGYVLVAIIAATVAASWTRQQVEKERRERKGEKKKHGGKTNGGDAESTSVSPFLPGEGIQPYVAPAGNSSQPPTVPILTTLSPEQVRDHPLLKAIQPFGLPQLPFMPPSGSGSESVSHPFHLSAPLLLRQGYMCSWNSKTRTADWCMECIHAIPTHDGDTNNSNSSGSAAASRSHSLFRIDPLIHPNFQSHNSDYKSTGYDRGHIVPAANAARTIPPGQLSSSSSSSSSSLSSPSSSSSASLSLQSIIDESFYLSNVAPQAPSLNRGFWQAFEEHLRHLAQKHGRILVISGPLWIPQRRMTDGIDAKPSSSTSTIMHDGHSSNHGNWQLRTDVLGSPPDSFVHVPTHFFKIVVTTPHELDQLSNPASSPASSPSSYPVIHLSSFIVPNSSTSPIPSDASLRSFHVPLERVEQYAGWQFFPRLNRSTALNGRRGGGGRRRLSRVLTFGDTSSLNDTAPVKDLCTVGDCEIRVRDYATLAQQSNNGKSKRSNA